MLQALCATSQEELLLSPLMDLSGAIAKRLPDYRTRPNASRILFVSREEILIILMLILV